MQWPLYLQKTGLIICKLLSLEARHQANVIRLRRAKQGSADDWPRARILKMKQKFLIVFHWKCQALQIQDLSSPDQFRA
jgi:hypothetical protein